MAEMTYLEAINLGISEEMARDEKVVIFGEDVGGDKGGVFGVTKGLAAKYGDERCFNTPLTEGLIGGLAVGLGLMGYRAIGEFQFADYILHCANRLSDPLWRRCSWWAVSFSVYRKSFVWTTRIKSGDPL